MDIFSTVSSAITLAQDIHSVFREVQGASEDLASLRHELSSIADIMDITKEIVQDDPILQAKFAPVIVQTVSTLQKLREITRQYEMAVASSRLRDKWRLLLKVMDKHDIAQYRTELHQQTAVMQAFGSFKSHKTMADVKSTVDFLRAAMELQWSRSPSPFDIMRTKDVQGHMLSPPPYEALASMAMGSVAAPDIVAYRKYTVDSFLASLDVGDRDQNIRKVAEADSKTCNWIHEHPSYKSWREDASSATLLLSGRMGCGKSVLTKHVMTEIAKDASHPPRPTDKLAVLNYFCSSVSRGVDNLDSAANILQALLHQFLFRRPQLFDSLMEETDVLDGQQVSETSKHQDWPLSTLWTILTTLFRLSAHSQVYCFIDAIDECAEKSIKEFLKLYTKSCKDDFTGDMAVKFFISSRKGGLETEVSRSLHKTRRAQLLEVKPHLVAPDVKLVIQKGLSRIDWLDLSASQTDQIQDLLTKKADGMFMWVRTALEMIEEADGLSFKAILASIDDMPDELEELYTSVLARVCKTLALEKGRMIIARDILGLLLHAYRPLTVGEMSIALAIDPNERTLEECKERMIPVGRFIEKHLSPFVVFVPPDEDQKGSDDEKAGAGPETVDSRARVGAESTVRVVHETAQDFLLKVCYGEISDSRFHDLAMTRQSCHEKLTEACLGYLCCNELQLGWISEDARDELGMSIVDDGTKSKIMDRLRENVFLGYSSVYWFRHLWMCEDRGADDAHNRALGFFYECQPSVACSYQVRQYLAHPDQDRYRYLSAPIHHAARAHSEILCCRILNNVKNCVNIPDPSGRTPLMLACTAFGEPEARDADVEIGKMLIEHGADLAAVDKSGDTALHWAARAGKEELLRMLLDRAISPDLPGAKGEAPLHLAIPYQPEVVQALLAKGADVNKANDLGYTPLHVCAINNAVDIVPSLLSKGAVVDSVDNDGYTPLHRAAQCGHAPVLELLIERGAALNMLTKSKASPLHYAASLGELECAKVLLKHGAIKDIPPGAAETVLCSAVKRKQLEAVKLLCDAGAEIHIKGPGDWSAIEVACFNGHAEVARVLLEHGANPNCTAASGSYAVLELAAREGHNETARVLCEFGADANYKDSRGWPVLGHACYANHPDVVRTLMENGADMHCEFEGYSALRIAVHYGYADAVAVLCDFGADVDGILNDWPFLARACYADHAALVRLLLERGAKLGCVAGENWTPLHLAVCAKSPTIVQLLVEWGADVYARSDDGYTPLGLAVHYEREDIAELLVKPGKPQLLYTRTREFKKAVVSEQSGEKAKAEAGEESASVDEVPVIKVDGASDGAVTQGDHGYEAGKNS